VSGDDLRAVPDEEETVDVDLDLIGDELRRETVGRPTTVKIDGVIIHVNHANSWPTSAMRAAGGGDWETWGRAVIEDDDEFQAFMDADLANFQVEAIFSQCARMARLNAGKSARFSGTRRNSRKR
jgi:hypothetical protein